MLCNDVGVQIVVPVGAMLAIRAGEPAGVTIVMGADVGREVGTPGEGTGA